MPYNIVTKDGIQLNNIPDDMPADAPQLKQLVMGERTKRRQASPEFQAKLEAQRASDRAQYDPTADMNWGEKALANVGAGMDTLWQGAKDITGNLSDADIQEQRATKEHLAEATTGGKALQFAGEAIPTLAIPAGGFVRGASLAGRGARALAGLPRAVEAAQAAGRGAQAARLGTGAAMADAALAGGTAGALQPTTEDESRLMNTGLGAGLGAALPGVAAGIRKGWRGFTQGGAAQRAAEAVQGELGPTGASDLRTAIGKQYYPRGAEDVPLSTAAVLENPALARMERTSRLDPAQQPGWFNLDKAQAEGAWNSLSRATGEGDELATRMGQRSSNWDTNWARAEQNLKPRNFQRGLEDLSQSLDNMAVSPDAMNSKVAAAIDEVQGNLAKAGENLSPEHIQKIRAQLNGKPSMKPGATALESAPRDAPAIQRLITQLDDLLNSATGGRWDPVREGYAADSASVRAAKAAQLVRGSFVDQATGRVQGAGSRFADVPEVTAAGIGRSMNAARMPDKSLALSTSAESQLSALQDALRKQQITQGVSRTAAPGGGSNTAGDLAGMAAGHAVGQLGVPSLALMTAKAAGSSLKNVGQRRYNEQLANALRDPSQMLKLLEAKVTSGQPLTREEEYALRSLRAGIVGADTAALPQ